jgi:hypothetical protein
VGSIALAVSDTALAGGGYTRQVYLTWNEVPICGNSMASSISYTSQNLSLSVNCSGNVNAGGYPVAGYDVWRSQDGGNTFTLLGAGTASYPPVSGIGANFQLTKLQASRGATLGQNFYIDSTVQLGTSYYYRVNPVDLNGNQGLPYDVKFADIPSGKNSLYVFRNSFNPTLSNPPPGASNVVPIQCGLQVSGHYWIRIYTLNGEFVDEVDNGESNGTPSAPFLSPQKSWNGKNSSGQTVASGVYLIHLECTDAGGKAGFHEDARVAVIK